MDKRDYDLIIIGAGPAGYVAALRAAQLGLKTACIDNWLNPDSGPSLGGTCLNAGCIPSKALLDSSLHYARCRKDLQEHGIRFEKLSLDMASLQTRKRRIVDQLTRGIASLFSAQGIEWLKGQGVLLGPHQVAFTAHQRKRPKTLTAEHIILAPGSHPARLEAAPEDGKYIVNSSDALDFTNPPGRLAIIGAGAIGTELGSVWNRLGSKVVLLEAQTTFLPIVDASLAQLAFRSYQTQGLEIRLGTRIRKTQISRQKVNLLSEDSHGERQERYDRVIVAIGRQPNTAGLYSDHSGLQLDERGFIGVDGHCRTNLPGVWAIGDAVRGPMLAHKGSQEGMMVVEQICGHSSELDYDLIPSVIYTAPELAWVGPSEQRLKQSGIPYFSGRFSMAANGRSLVRGDATGEVKLLAHAETDRLLAAHIFAPEASELIAQAMIVLSMEGSAEDLARTLFAHPSLSEAVHEAALDVSGQAIHKADPRRH